MKSIKGMKIISSAIIKYSFCLLLVAQASYSQERSLISPYLQLQYFKDTELNRVLKTTLTYSENRMEMPLGGMKISFYAGSDGKSKIAEILTDESGIALLTLREEMNPPVDKNGYWTFSSEFEGNDTIETAMSELLIKDISLEMDLTEVDSIKNVVIRVFGNDMGKEVPVEGELVTVYVPRMFSLLPVGEITLDDTGSGSLEFPADLPGDKDGNLTIIAKIEEHPDYGNIERRSTVNWGLVPDYSVPPGHRALWTKTAPRWMIYTLTILLTGVWAHYLYVIISLVRIKRNAARKDGKLGF